MENAILLFCVSDKSWEVQDSRLIFIELILLFDWDA